MKTKSTFPQPGNYTYVYPTFLDSPEHICIHGFTPDRKYAFVSYPGHPNQKPPQAVKVTWFKTVILEKSKDNLLTTEELCLN